METIDICLAANAKYFPGMFTTAASIAMHASKGYRLSFNLLETDVSDTDYDELVVCVSRIYPESEFHRFNVEKYDFKSLQTWHGNRLAYARFLIGELRPDLEYVIYSDVDMLWLADVAELWGKRDAQKVMLAVNDNHILDVGEGDNYKRHGLILDTEKYFCSGMLLINLRRYRELDVTAKCVEFLEKNKDYVCPDQTALNQLIGNEVRLIERSWMTFTFDLKKLTCSRPIVLHYANELPWIRDGAADLLTDTVLIWYDVYARALGVSRFAALRRLLPHKRLIVSRVLYVLCASRLPSFLMHVLWYLFGKAGKYWRMRRWAFRVKVM